MPFCCIKSQVRDKDGKVMLDKDGKPIMRKIGTIKKGKKGKVRFLCIQFLELHHFEILLLLTWFYVEISYLTTNYLMSLFLSAGRSCWLWFRFWIQIWWENSSSYYFKLTLFRGSSWCGFCSCYYLCRWVWESRAEEKGRARWDNECHSGNQWIVQKTLAMSVHEK